MQYTDQYRADVLRIARMIPGIASLRDSTIVVTGASGLLGSSIVDLLLSVREHDVPSLSIIVTGRNRQKVEKRFAGYAEGRDYRFCPFDATKNAPVSIPADYVVYAASNSDPAQITSKPVETILANTTGLNVFLEAAVEHGAKGFLYVSSSEVYGKNGLGSPWTETDYGHIDCLNPRSGYACSKRLAESLCSAYHAEHGLGTTIVRPGHIYGPAALESDSHVVTQFLRTAKRGEDIVMASDGTQVRSYCHSLDCASAALAVLLNGASCEAYNIADRRAAVSIAQLADIIAGEAGVRVVRRTASLDEKAAFNPMDNSALDATKLCALGWRPYYTLEGGIRQSLALI